MKLDLHRSLTFWCGIFVMAFLSWGGWKSRSYPESMHVLGTVNLLNKESEDSVAGTLPSRSEGSPWGLRFSCAKRGNDRIKVFLRNDNPGTLGFYKGRDRGELKLKPGEKGVIFEGSCDELSLAGRKEERELTFRSTTTEEMKFSIALASDADDAGEITVYSHYVSTGYSIPRWVPVLGFAPAWAALLFWRARRRKRAAAIAQAALRHRDFC